MLLARNQLLLSVLQTNAQPYRSAPKLVKIRAMLSSTSAYQRYSRTKLPMSMHAVLQCDGAWGHWTSRLQGRCHQASTCIHKTLDPGLRLAARPGRPKLGRLGVAVLPRVAVLPHAGVRAAGGRLRGLQLLQGLAARTRLHSQLQTSRFNVRPSC
jgi:hypothetical protein